MTWTIASSRHRRTRHATAGPSGCSGMPIFVVKPRKTLSESSLLSAAAWSLAAASTAVDREEDRAGLRVGRVSSLSTNSCASVSSWGLAHFAESWAICGQSSPRSQPPHDELGDGGGGLVGRQPLQRLLNARVGVDWEMSPS